MRDNQHIVDAYFYWRMQKFLSIYFGANALDARWIWFRIEYQGRGAAHAHGCCRLNSDPGMTDLGFDVMEGRKWQRLLEYFQKDLLAIRILEII